MHTPNCYGSPQNILRANIEIWLKIQHVCAYNFANCGSNLTKIYQVTWSEAGVIR